MIEPNYNKQNITIFLGFDSIEINLIGHTLANRPQIKDIKELYCLQL